MSILSRLTKLEQAALNKRDTKVEIYIIGDIPGIDYWGNKIDTVKPGDTIINVTDDDYDELY